MSWTLSMAGFKELVAKYGKVAVGVHMTVSAVSVTCCYAAIKSNVDVGAVLQRVGLYSASMEKEEADDIQKYEAVALEGTAGEAHTEDRHAAVHAAVSGGGAVALAVLCNKALMPIRIPITVALTPPWPASWPDETCSKAPDALETLEARVTPPYIDCWTSAARTGNGATNISL